MEEIGLGGNGRQLRVALFGGPTAPAVCGMENNKIFNLQETNKHPTIKMLTPISKII